jgi:hypothetical protein
MTPQVVKTKNFEITIEGDSKITIIPTFEKNKVQFWTRDQVDPKNGLTFIEYNFKAIQNKP